MCQCSRPALRVHHKQWLLLLAVVMTAQHMQLQAHSGSCSCSSSRHCSRLMMSSMRGTFWVGRQQMGRQQLLLSLQVTRGGTLQQQQQQLGRRVVLLPGSGAHHLAIPRLSKRTGTRKYSSRSCAERSDATDAAIATLTSASRARQAAVAVENYRGQPLDEASAFGEQVQLLDGHAAVAELAKRRLQIAAMKQELKQLQRQERALKRRRR